MSGDVSVLRERDNFRKWALTQGEKLEVKDEVVTGLDGRATFELADGSTIQVFPNSHFAFRKNPPSWRDLLDLYLGKVRVHIEHLNGKPNPHKIHTNISAISVRGTTFEITVDEDETTLVEVEEGLVEVRHLLLPTGETREVRAGEAIRVHRDEPIARGNGKGEIFRRALRVALDAIVVAGRPGAGGGGGIPGSGGGGPVGDTDPGTAPPPGGTSAPGAPPGIGPGAPPPIGGPGAPPGTP